MVALVSLFLERIVQFNLAQQVSFLNLFFSQISFSENFLFLYIGILPTHIVIFPLSFRWWFCSTQLPTISAIHVFGKTVLKIKNPFLLLMENLCPGF